MWTLIFIFSLLAVVTLLLVYLQRRATRRWENMAAEYSTRDYVNQDPDPISWGKPLVGRARRPTPITRKGPTSSYDASRQQTTSPNDDSTIMFRSVSQAPPDGGYEGGGGEFGGAGGSGSWDAPAEVSAPDTSSSDSSSSDSSASSDGGSSGSND